MRIPVVCNFLYSLFLTTQHSAPYTIAGFISVLYTFYFNFVGIFMSNVNPVVSLHFDQAIFTLLFTPLSAPPLSSNNEPKYLDMFTVCTSFVLIVVILVLFWAWHVGAYSVFLCLLLVRGTQMYLSISLAAPQLLLYYVHK